MVSGHEALGPGFDSELVLDLDMSKRKVKDSILGEIEPNLLGGGFFLTLRFVSSLVFPFYLKSKVVDGRVGLRDRCIERHG